MDCMTEQPLSDTEHACLRFVEFGELRSGYPTVAG